MSLLDADELRRLEGRPYWPHLHSAVGQPIRAAIRAEWSALLQAARGREEEYQPFLANHAGFFFANRSDTVLVLSKVRLGSTLETDFVVLTDEKSQGFRYEFIEIEVPQCPGFTSAGDPRSRLSHAIQQLEDWRRWLDANREEAKRLFPSPQFLDRDIPNFTFTIVIGTRSNTERWLHKRNALAERLGIHVRSFDAFTDSLDARVFIPFAANHRFQLSDIELRHEIVNPFVAAYSHRAWTSIVAEPRFERRAHPIEANLEILIRHRSVNARYGEFLASLKALPVEERSFYRLWAATSPR